MRTIQIIKAGGAGASGVFGANKNFRGAHLVGDDSKTAGNIPSQNEFFSSTDACGNAHRKKIIVITFPNAKSQVDLFDIADAIEMAGFSPCLGE